MATNRTKSASRLPRYADQAEILKRAIAGDIEAVNTTLIYLTSNNSNLRRMMQAALHDQRQPQIWRCLLGLLSLGLWGDIESLYSDPANFEREINAWLNVDWHEDRFHALAEAFAVDESEAERSLKDDILKSALFNSSEMRNLDPLSSTMQNFQYASAYLLGLRGHTEVISVLDEIIDLGDLGWKLLAVQALAALHDRRCGNPLVKALATGRGILHQEARRALCDLGHLAEEAWVEALHHSDGHIRWHAARALSQIGDPQAVGILAEGLHDPSHAVRWTTARVLASMDSPAIPCILHLVAHHPLDEPFRQACYHALHAMPSQRTQEYLRPLLEALSSSTASVQAPRLAYVMLQEWVNHSQNTSFDKHEA